MTKKLLLQCINTSHKFFVHSRYYINAVQNRRLKIYTRKTDEISFLNKLLIFNNHINQVSNRAEACRYNLFRMFNK